MASWKGRKRPWEDDSPIELPLKRRGSAGAAPVASVSRPSSPPPPRAGYYSRDSQMLNQRRLPPLYISSCNTSAESATPRTVQSALQAQQAKLLETTRPRAQSLYNGSQHPDWQEAEGSTEYPIADSPTVAPSTISPPLGDQVHQPHLGTGPAPHAVGAAICCPSTCQGHKCSTARVLMRHIATELTLLHKNVTAVTQTEHHAPKELPGVESVTTAEALQGALDIVQWANLNLQEHLALQYTRNSENLSQPRTSPSMRRGQHHLEEREEQSPPTRQYPTAHHGYYPLPTALPEDVRRNPYPGEMSSHGNSPHHTTPSSGSTFMPPQSPMQAPQAIRSAILPSPSSLNFPHVPSLPSISPPSTAAQTSAQSAHLQDLQHQISVKTLAFQTLQREYDSLLQKLERQRTKCATLEKKFEVSDVEINGLTDEKEKLHIQVATLETQVAELQQGRDEARRQLVANGAQYMRIMEMANRLQAQGAEDKKKWEAERVELEQRVRLLEEAMVTGAENLPSDDDQLATASPAVSTMVLLHNPASSNPSQSETINVLRTEVSRLRARTQTLETALQTMRRESVAIQVAARQLVDSSGKLESVAQGAVGSGG